MLDRVLIPEVSGGVHFSALLELAGALLAK
jgi:hypothetical protein